jgi:hypothetical protein
MLNNDLETPPPPAAAPSGGGCMTELGWIAASFVLPLASISFYRRVVRRSVGSAVLFFVCFMGIITLVSTLGLALKVSAVSTEIRRVFDSGIVPEITIHDGIASVKGQQPAVLLDNNRTFVAIDTTGKITSIDQSRYTTGFLLTRTDLHILSTNAQYQVLPLTQVQQIFTQDPLVINGETTAQFWRGFTGVFAIAIFLGLAIWNLAVRFVYLAFLALILWGITCLFRPKTPYGVVLSVGIFAFVPVIYFINIIDRIGRSFFLLQTLLLLVVWLVALNLALTKDSSGYFGEGQPLRGWRALLGLPLLVVLALDAIFVWQNGGWFDLLALGLTLILLVAAGLFTRTHSEPNPGLPTSPTGPVL